MPMSLLLNGPGSEHHEPVAVGGDSVPLCATT